MSYMDIANIATDMSQVNNINKEQIWGLKSMMDNQSNVVQQLLGEVNNNLTQTTSNIFVGKQLGELNNNPPQTGNNINVKA